MLGNMIIKSTIGIPTIVGVIKEVNKFSFIFLLKVQASLMMREISARGSQGICILRLLIGGR